MSLPDPWPDFALDPRRPEHAAVRAADADRDVVAAVLAEAYAQGRLDRDEYDERSAHAQGARTLGDLPPLIADLVAPVPGTSLAHPGPAGAVAHPFAGASPTVHEQAVQRWERDRREALAGWLIPSLITWVVWSVTMFGQFPWPAIVTAATFAPLLRVMIAKQDIVARHRDKIEAKQAKRARKNLEDGGSGPDELAGPPE